MAWGWRLPFIGSAALVVIGIFIRLRIQETPDFERVVREGTVARFPVLETILHHPKDLLIGLGARITEISWIYVITIFGLSYAVTNLGLVPQPGARRHRARRHGRADHDTAVRASVRPDGPAQHLSAGLRCGDPSFIPDFLGDRDARSRRL